MKRRRRRKRRRLVKLMGGKAELGVEAGRWCGQSREERMCCMLEL